jgi:hypothetical protein
VKNLAHALDKVTAVLEKLRQRDHVWQGLAEMGLEVPDLRRVGARAGQKACTRRRADRLLAIGAAEDHPRSRDAVNVRTLDDRVAITPQFRAEGSSTAKKIIGLGRRGWGRQEMARAKIRSPKSEGEGSAKPEGRIEGILIWWRVESRGWQMC